MITLYEEQRDNTKGAIICHTMCILMYTSMDCLAGYLTTTMPETYNIPGIALLLLFLILYVVFSFSFSFSFSFYFLFVNVIQQVWRSLMAAECSSFMVHGSVLFLYFASDCSGI